MSTSTFAHAQRWAYTRTQTHTHVLLLSISPQLPNRVCLRPNFHCSPVSTHTGSFSLLHIHTHIYMHKHSSVQLVDPFHGTKVKGILSNLSSLISPLTHVYQRRDPCCYLGNQTGSVGGQGFQVLLLSSLCFPLVALQEQTQQQQRLITRWCERLKWPCGPHWLMWMRFWESWCDCVTRRCTPWWKTYQMHSLPSYQVREIWPSAWCLRIWK